MTLDMLELIKYLMINSLIFKNRKLKLMTVKGLTMPVTARPSRPSSQELSQADRAFPPVTLRLQRNAPPIRRVPVSVARRFNQICTAMAAESIASADLTTLQYAVLVYLSAEFGGEPGIDQSGLAARIGIDRNNASLLVEEMVKRGLVERRVNGDDRRARLLYLTPKGEKLYARLRPGNLAANHRILEPLGPRDRELLLDLLIKVIDANWEYARPGAGRRKRSSRKPQPDNGG
jgi:DNA-binding MarR family transcriptional regulator